MADETLLVVSGDGMPPTAVRGISETLEPIDGAANIRRTVNGGAVDLSPSQFKKYRLTLQCSDMDSPAFDAIELGDMLTIQCVSELARKDVGSPVGWSRTMVAGSERTANGFVFARPELTVIVTGKSQETDEYGARTSWSLEAEEV